MQDYSKAIKFIKVLLEVQPDNHQIQDLYQYIRKKERRGDLNVYDDEDIFFSVSFVIT